MFPDWVSNPGPLTYESGALAIALRGPAVNFLYVPNRILFISDVPKFTVHNNVKNTLKSQVCNSENVSLVARSQKEDWSHQIIPI